MGHYIYDSIHYIPDPIDKIFSSVICVPIWRVPDVVVFTFVLSDTLVSQLVQLSFKACTVFSFH